MELEMVRFGSWCESFADQDLEKVGGLMLPYTTKKRRGSTTTTNLTNLIAISHICTKKAEQPLQGLNSATNYHKNRKIN